MESMFRSVEVAQILGTLVAAIAAVLARIEKSLLNRLDREGAFSQKDAVPLTPRYAIVRWRLSRLVARNAIRTTDEGRFFHDREANRRLRKRRLTITIPAVIVAVVLTLVLHRLFG